MVAPRFYDSTKLVKPSTSVVQPKLPKEIVPLMAWEEDGKYWHTAKEVAAILKKRAVKMSVASIYATCRTRWVEDYHYRCTGPHGGRREFNIWRILKS